MLTAIAPTTMASATFFSSTSWRHRWYGVSASTILNATPNTTTPSTEWTSAASTDLSANASMSPASRLPILRILVEEVAGPSVDPHEIAEVVGELEVHRLVREVDAVGFRAQEELVAEVARLVEDAEHRREVRVAVREGEGDQIVGVHE